jgi:putative peptide zinc metalloprotease protein
MQLATQLGNAQVGLRSNLEVSRHLVRSRPCYVVRNPVTFQSHQLSIEDYQILVALDESKTLSEVFDRLKASGQLKPDQEEEFYRFVVQLQQFGVLNLPISDAGVLYTRFKRRRETPLSSRLMGYLFWRIPLINPDRFLDRTAHWFAPLFTPLAFVAWLILVSVAGTLVMQRWADFQTPLASILATRNIISTLCVLIVLKVWHEFGHAYACKVFGGRVPEMGAFLICLTPCAYVDASAAWGFSKKLHRIVVSLAGMYVETGIAAIAALIWAVTGPSLLNSIAHQVVLLASVVTIAFNMNPLMRYDGYYVLSDLIEVPNLRQRSTEALTTLCKRMFLGIRTPPPQYPVWLRISLLCYGVASTIWKVGLVFGISVMIAMKFYVVGILLAVCYAGSSIVGAVTGVVRYLWFSEETARVRKRSVALAALLIVGALVGTTIVPLSKPVVADAVVARESESVIHVPVAGFLQAVGSPSGERVAPGSLLLSLENPEITADVLRARAEYAELETRYRIEQTHDREAAMRTFQKLQHAGEALAEATRKQEQLIIRASDSGVLVTAIDESGLGRFLQVGEPVATVGSGSWTLVCLATEEDIADVHPQVGDTVTAKIAGVLLNKLTGTVIRIAEAGSPIVEQTALTQIGGGTIAVADSTMQARQSYFKITIKLDQTDPIQLQHGTTAAVCLAKSRESLGTKVYRWGLKFLNQLRAS